MMERQVYYLGQVIPQIDAEIAEKGHFWMETSELREPLKVGTGSGRSLRM